MNQSRRYGEATAIAKEYGVSRWFVYFYQSVVKTLLVLQLQTSQLSQFDSIPPTKLVLSLYLNTQSSIQGIHLSLKDLYGDAMSRSKIGQILQTVGQLLPSHEQGVKMKLCILSDELFLNRQPVLITIDPQSLYILSIELATQRDADSWGYVWLEMTGNKTERITLLCSDKGKGITSAAGQLLTESLYNYDLFHYLRPLFKAYAQLKQKAQKAFTKLENMEHKLQNPPAELTIWANIADQSPKHAQKLATLQQKRADLQAQLNSTYSELELLLEQLHELDQLLTALKQALAFIDPSGKLQTPTEVEEQLNFIFDYLLLIDQAAIQKAAHYLRKHAADATRYYQTISQINTQIPKHIPDPFIAQVCLWIWDLKRQSKIATAKQKAYLKKQIAEWTQLLQEELSKATTQQYLQWVTQQMSTVVRSSSLIENLNGRIRMFAHAARGQLTQARLNIIRFYLNHKPFNRSRCEDRKGYSPFQLFHQKKDDTRTWWDILEQDYLPKMAA